ERREQDPRGRRRPDLGALVARLLRLLLVDDRPDPREPGDVDHGARRPGPRTPEATPRPAALRRALHRRRGAAQRDPDHALGRAAPVLSRPRGANARGLRPSRPAGLKHRTLAASDRRRLTPNALAASPNARRRKPNAPPHAGR